MAGNKYVDLSGLTYYDEKIKALIKAQDESTLTAAKNYCDDKDDLFESAGAAATVQGKLDEEVARAKAAEQANATAAANAKTAADNAQAAADAAQSDVNALETYVGTIPQGASSTNIVAYIAEKTEGIATDTALAELQAQVNKNKTDIATVKGDYLKSSDKTELQNNIDAEKADREAADTDLDTRLKKTEAFFVTAENETLDTALDTLIEIQTYITTEGAAADQMVRDIAANTKAISDEVTRATAAEDALDARIDTLESAIGESGSVADDIATAKQEAINTAAADATSKADAALASAKTYADGLNTAMDSRVDALEATTHTHTNRALLDTYTQTEVDLADAVAKKHEHGNMTILDGISDTAISTWNTVTSKAAQTDLEAEVSRAMAAEQANADAIAAFTAITSDEIDALFTVST